MSAKSKNMNAADNGTAAAGDFAGLDISPAFKPINSAAKTARDEYEVAMTGPAAFMSPAPTKPEAKTQTGPSIAELAASVEEASRNGQAQDAKPARNKLPIYAAVAASLACVAVLGAQSWPSASASSGTASVFADGAAVSIETTAPAVALAGVSDQSATPAALPPTFAGDADPSTDQPMQQLAMAAPAVTDSTPSSVIIEQPLAVIPVDDAPVIPKTEFIPLESGISHVAKADTALSRSDCDGRYNTVSRSGAINFESGSATLLRSSEPMLQLFANVFENCRRFKIAVAGHTDSVGKASLNQALSEKRAASVARYLVKLGVPADSLHVVGYGESKPIVSNDTSLKRSQNRRIEFRIFDG